MGQSGLMVHSQLTRQFPRLADALAGRSDPSEAVRHLVDTALKATGVTPGTTIEEVATLVRTLDEAAWDLQDLHDRGEATTESYTEAFRRARAANALLDSLSGRDDAAAYEAAHALGADEDVLVGLVEGGARSSDL